MITSLQNSKIKLVRALQNKAKARRESGLFVCEGVRLVEEALHSDWQVQVLLYGERTSARGKDLAQVYAAQGGSVETVTDAILAEIGDTENNQGIFAVVSAKALGFPLAPNFIFIPAQVRDPGNLGTMLRSAAAAGVQVVLIPPATRDPFAPKVLRSCIGAHFRLPISVLSWEGIREYLGSLAQVRVLAAAMERGKPYTGEDMRVPLAIMVGGEAFGADEKALSLVDGFVHIPMPGKMESLNAATAAAILLFEVIRQRES